MGLNTLTFLNKALTYLCYSAGSHRALVHSPMCINSSFDSSKVYFQSVGVVLLSLEHEKGTKRVCIDNKTTKNPKGTNPLGVINCLRASCLLVVPDFVSALFLHESFVPDFDNLVLSYEFVIGVLHEV